MDLPPDINTDDEKCFMPEEDNELPPDVDTDSEFVDAVCTSCGCTCSRNCRSCFDAVAIAELRGRSEGMSEELTSIASTTPSPMRPQGKQLERTSDE